MSKETIYGADSRSAMLRGIDSLAEAVKITMGPKGRSVLVQKKFGSPIVTRDGVTVAKEIELQDRFENMGAQMVKEVAESTAQMAGDGTTTATVMAQTMVREGFKLVTAGANPVDLQRGMAAAVKTIVQRLESNSHNFFADVSEAAKATDLPTLAELLAEEGLDPATIKKFQTENARLKVRKNFPLISRLVLSALSAGLDTGAASRLASKVLAAQSRLGVAFEGMKHKQMTTLAANCAGNDVKVGAIIADAIQSVGIEGIIQIEDSPTMETFLEVVDGMQLDRGYLSPYFITDTQRMEAVLDNHPLILLHEKKISSGKELVPILEQVAKMGRSLLIIAEDVEGEALATLVVNKVRGTLKVAAVKAPDFGDRLKTVLEDIAILSGGRVIKEELGLSLANAKIEDLGEAGKITIGKDKTIIMGAGGEPSEIDGRVNAVRVQAEKTKSDYDREKLQARLAKLLGGIAVIRVGAVTETEMKEKKERVEDALHATRAAIEEGIGPGGGVALLRCIDALDSLESSEDESLGVRIIRLALESPMRQIAKNAGHEGSVVVNQTRASKEENFGFNVQSGEFTDMVKAGITDPTKVTRVALQNAASIASVMLMTEGLLAESPAEAMTGKAAV